MANKNTEILADVLGQELLENRSLPNEIISLKKRRINKRLQIPIKS